jgi:glucose-6-phosphate isomerase
MEATTMAEMDPISPLLKYDPAGVFGVDAGFRRATEDLAPRLEAARREAIDDVELRKTPQKISDDKKPLDSAFIDLPERVLAAYEGDRNGSELGRILAEARRMAAVVDRVVVLGIGGSYMGARALLEACCHPYWNEFNRDARSYPRMYFEGNNLDSDAMQGLFDLLVDDKGVDGAGPWGLVPISKSGETLETAVALRIFLDAAANKRGAGSKSAKPAMILPITGEGSPMSRLISHFEPGPSFAIPDGVGGRFSILTPVGLVPAAILGLNVVALLQGASAMNEHFRTAPAHENVVLRYVAVGHVAEERLGLSMRVLSTWGKKLEAVGFWYDQLLAESLGKGEKGATPLTVVNSRDLHSRGQQHQEGRRDKLITNLSIDRPCCDPLRVPNWKHDEDELNKYAGKTVDEMLEAARLGTNQAYQKEQRPTADLTLIRSPNDKLEHALGQLLQMLMLATVVEGRLIGINPYGQPGVQAYKTNTKAILSSGK